MVGPCVLFGFQCSAQPDSPDGFTYLNPYDIKICLCTSQPKHTLCIGIGMEESGEIENRSPLPLFGYSYYRIPLM
jgi:hypothetical protein